MFSPRVSTGASLESVTGVTAHVDEGQRVSFRQTYHEIADRHVVEVDVIEQLRSNLAQLEDLTGRMGFLMSEVAYLLKIS